MEEYVIWDGSPSLKDLYLNPIYVVFTILLSLLVGFGLLLALINVLSRKTTRFCLTNERVQIETGILSKRLDDVELYRIKDTKVIQGFFDRILNIGNIKVATDDLTGNFILWKIQSPREVREAIRRATEECKISRQVRIISN